MKDKILELRAKGYTYNQIVEELGCSKGTVAYHCGSGQKKKTLDRQRSRRENKLFGRLYGFRDRERKPEYELVETLVTAKHAIQKRVRGFQAKLQSRGYDFSRVTFSYDSFMELHGDTKHCYLTGRPIDLNVSTSYSFDHIEPVSKGGSNELDNLGITCPEANFAKRDLSLEDFIELCLDVVINFGLVEEKK